jgi:hypothetical protein
MPVPTYIEGRVASLADVSGSITIDQILTNNTVLYQGEELLVPQTETTIVTSPANGVKYITKIICTGVVNARWDVYVNSVLAMTKRTTDRTVDFDFSTPWKIAASSVVDVKATHHGPDTTADFVATIMGYQP